MASLQSFPVFDLLVGAHQPSPPRPPALLVLQISLDARRIRLMRLPEGKASSGASASGTRQMVYEVCVCPNGRLFLSQAGTGSTCQISNNVCL